MRQSLLLVYFSISSVYLPVYILSKEAESKNHTSALITKLLPLAMTNEQIEGILLAKLTLANGAMRSFVYVVFLSSST